MNIYIHIDVVLQSRFTDRKKGTAVYTAAVLL